MIKFSNVISLNKSVKSSVDYTYTSFYNVCTLSDLDYYLVKYGNVIINSTNIIVLRSNNHTTYHNYYFYKKDRKTDVSKIISDKMSDGYQRCDGLRNLTSFTDDIYQTDTQIKKVNILFNVILSKKMWSDDDIKNMNSISKIKFVLCVLGKKLTLNQMLFLNSIYKSEMSRALVSL